MGNRVLFSWLLFVGCLIGGPVYGQSSNWAFFVDDTGDVGVGTNSPSAQLHVLGDDGAKFLVENTGAALGTKIMFNLVNSGGIRFDMFDKTTGSNWVFQNQFGSFDVTLAGTGTREFRFYPNGNLEILGSYLQSSSRAIKHDVHPVDQRSVLDKVVALPINQWSYNREEGVRHMGPMSEDFMPVLARVALIRASQRLTPAVWPWLRFRG